MFFFRHAKICLYHSPFGWLFRGFSQYGHFLKHTGVVNMFYPRDFIYRTFGQYPDELHKQMLIIELEDTLTLSTFYLNNKEKIRHTQRLTGLPLTFK